MHTPNEIKAIKKQRAAASRAYAAAREAHAEITRQANAAAARAYNALYNPLRK
jgi:hypothetical protein